MWCPKFVQALDFSIFRGVFHCEKSSSYIAYHFRCHKRFCWNKTYNHFSVCEVAQKSLWNFDSIQGNFEAARKEFEKWFFVTDMNFPKNFLFTVKWPKITIPYFPMQTSDLKKFCFTKCRPQCWIRLRILWWSLSVKGKYRYLWFLTIQSQSRTKRKKLS